MNPQHSVSADRRQRVESIFQRAADAPADERSGLVFELSGGDESVIAEVKSLLAEFDAGTLSMLKRPADAGPLVQAMFERPGDVLGKYTLIEPLGEGGFGAVYVAEQKEPVRRRVALKILKAGMDTQAVLARFEAERQALALMDHPSIAKVLDAGSTPLGRPYFVMELVSGQPLTRACDARRLTTRGRLELFVEVCRAVQHAHQKGVIHRDLKPSNILVGEVDGRAVPRVIDFGIAKATTAHLVDRPAHTEQDQLIGTPEYMSPEQAGSGGQDIDTRTDVYSLGVILYELLTGSLPFDSGALRSGGLLRMQQVIRDVEPPRPSTRLTALSPDAARAAASNRGTDLATLRRSIRGDLEWIVLRAMEKDRSRRYDSAAALAADIERYLNDEPVLASPPGALYSVMKFTRRHKASVAAGVGVAVALLGGSGFAFVGFLNARTERDRAVAAELAARSSRDEAAAARDRAQLEARKASAVNEFFLERMLSAAKPWKGGREITMTKALDAAAAQIDGSFEDQPEIKAAIQFAIGDTYHSLGADDKAVRYLRESFEGRRALLGASHPDTLEAEIELIIASSLVSGADMAPRVREIVALIESTLGPDHEQMATAMTAQAAIGQRMGRIGESLAMSQKVVDWHRRWSEQTPAALQGALIEHASALMSAGKPAEAIKSIDEALAMDVGDSGPSAAAVAQSLAVKTQAQELAGDTEAAEATGLRAVEECLKAFGDDHPTTMIARVSLANALKELGKLEAAEATYRIALDTLVRGFGEEHIWTLTVATNHANALNRLGRRDEAETILRRTLEVRRRILGDQHRDVAMSLEALASVVQRQGRAEEAVALFTEAVTIGRKAVGPDHPDFQNMLSNLAHAQAKAGMHADAVRSLDELVVLEARVMGPGHRYTLTDHTALAESLLAAGDATRALEAAREVHRLTLEHQPDHFGLGQRTRVALARALLANASPEEASSLAQEVLERATAMPDDDKAKPGRLRTAGELLAEIATARGDTAAAAEWLERYPAPPAN